MRRIGICCIVAAVSVTACARGSENADTTAGMTAAAAGTAAAPAPAATPAAPALTFAELAGRWNGRAVPESGADTAATTFVLVAAADSTGWKMEFPGRAPLPTRVTLAGDSVTTEVGPYASVRRKGVQVTTISTMRKQGDKLVGTGVAHYKSAGADSVLRLRLEAVKAP